ncbi:S-Ena type endospore appendage [Neobacillus sp. NPDC093127]|uniref:S-Ena type endospore appendage n=1 Tax=Neobacillus sp. NPDC093127 TaxID=3364296 RepID=UPI00381C13DD
MCGNCCPDRPFTTDDICGNFDTTVATTPLTVYDQDTAIISSGTISIFYDRGTPADITFSVNGTPFPTPVPKGNTISHTFDNIDSLSIDTAGALGKYCITLHYQV